MIKFNKVFNSKIISLILACIFLFTNITYGIGIPERPHLRKPLDFNGLNVTPRWLCPLLAATYHDAILNQKLSSEEALKRVMKEIINKNAEKLGIKVTAFEGGIRIYHEKDNIDVLVNDNGTFGPKQEEHATDIALSDANQVIKNGIVLHEGMDFVDDVDIPVKEFDFGADSSELVDWKVGCASLPIQIYDSDYFAAAKIWSYKGLKVFVIPDHKFEHTLLNLMRKALGFRFKEILSDAHDDAGYPAEYEPLVSEKASEQEIIDRSDTLTSANWRVALIKDGTISDSYDLLVIKANEGEGRILKLRLAQFPAVTPSKTDETILIIENDSFGIFDSEELERAISEYVDTLFELNIKFDEIVFVDAGDKLSNWMIGPPSTRYYREHILRFLLARLAEKYEGGVDYSVQIKDNLLIAKNGSEPITESQVAVDNAIPAQPAKSVTLAPMQIETATHSPSGGPASTSTPTVSAQSYLIPTEENRIPSEWGKDMEQGIFMEDGKESALTEGDSNDINSQAVSIMTDLTPAEQKKFEEIKDKDEFIPKEITIKGKKYNFKLYNINGRAFLVQENLSKEERLSDSAIRTQLANALSQNGLKNLDSESPYLILRPKRSHRLFGDCLTNHILYINQDFDNTYEILGKQTGDTLLQVGLEHELFHEALVFERQVLLEMAMITSETTNKEILDIITNMAKAEYIAFMEKVEKLQIDRDITRLAEITKGQNIGLSAMLDTLRSIGVIEEEFKAEVQKELLVLFPALPLQYEIEESYKPLLESIFRILPPRVRDKIKKAIISFKYPDVHLKYGDGKNKGGVVNIGWCFDPLYFIEVALHEIGESLHTEPQHELNNGLLLYVLYPEILRFLARQDNNWKNVYLFYKDFFNGKEYTREEVGYIFKLIEEIRTVEVENYDSFPFLREIQQNQRKGYLPTYKFWRKVIKDKNRNGSNLSNSPDMPASAQAGTLKDRGLERQSMDSSL